MSVIVVPHDDSRTWNFRFSYVLLYTFVAIVGIGIIAGVTFIFSYGRILLTAEKAALLARENSRLKERVAQVDSLQLELVNLQAMAIQIKGMLGVQMSKEDSMLVAILSPDAQSQAISPEDVPESVAASEQKMMLDAIPSLWPVKGFVTRKFMVTGGERNPQYHPGIDIAAERNTPVRSAADGVVESSRFDDTYGWMVEIDHGYGFHSVYGHNTRNLVNQGDRVTRGKTIAFLGSTGKSTAPHLHFEVRKNGVPVDPEEYLLH